MITAQRMVLLVTLAAISFRLASAQEPQTVTTTEPGVYQLSELYKHADIVALVKVVAGDTESYATTVYKAKIMAGYKGVGSDSTIYFGPYAGERLGWEYVLFLRGRTEMLRPKTTLGAGFGSVRYAEIFDQGHSSMETGYACVFDGGEISQQCDDGVRVCTDYIKLPAGTKTFPSEAEDTDFGCRWVRKSAFLSLLESLGKPKQ